MSTLSSEQSGKVNIVEEGDIVQIRNVVRTVCRTLGFNDTDVTRVVTAASELARNVNRYAGTGEMRWSITGTGEGAGLELVFEDEGPGIPDVALAMSPGFSSVRGLGLGLPGAKRLMDEFEIWSAPGKGTKVTVRKWRNANVFNTYANQRTGGTTNARRA